jgi:hypothetical protein
VRRFVSYVAAEPGDEGSDPDGLGNDARLSLEAKAIALICSREPVLQPTPARNPGFDLIETDLNGERWVKVKAMTGNLENRPVGLSSVQFSFAWQHGEQYWLYVVEYAGEAQKSRIVKIQDPAGRAGTFTFDSGWAEVAEII